MKLLLAILLTAGAAFAQASVNYVIVQPTCIVPQPLASHDPSLQCVSSPEIHVTATSANPLTIGVFVTVEYRAASGNFVTTSIPVLARDPAGDFSVSLVLGSNQVFRVSAVELLAGATAIAP